MYTLPSCPSQWQCPLLPTSQNLILTQCNKHRKVFAHLVARSTTRGVSWTEGIATSGTSLDTMPCFEVNIRLVAESNCFGHKDTSSPFWVADCRRIRHRRIIFRNFYIGARAVFVTGTEINWVIWNFDARSNTATCSLSEPTNTEGASISLPFPCSLFFLRCPNSEQRNVSNGWVPCLECASTHRQLTWTWSICEF